MLPPVADTNGLLGLLVRGCLRFTLILSRHLSTEQRAAVAAEIANMKHGTNRYEQKVEGPNDPLISIKQAAEMMGVSQGHVSIIALGNKRENRNARQFGWMPVSPADAAIVAV